MRYCSGKSNLNTGHRTSDARDKEPVHSQMVQLETSTRVVTVEEGGNQHQFTVPVYFVIPRKVSYDALTSSPELQCPETQGPVSNRRIFILKGQFSCFNLKLLYRLSFRVFKWDFMLAALLFSG